MMLVFICYGLCEGVSCVTCVILSCEQALHDALMRQEELLAYIDRQQEAKFHVGLESSLASKYISWINL